ncbi:MAG: porin [Acidobacteriota bacterium]|nr:porin [Acidobacteriota bacterium]
MKEMRIHMGVAFAMAAISVHLSTPIVADDAWEVTWKEGTRIESADDRFRLQIGGRVQADYAFAVSQSDALEQRFGKFEDFSELRRARLFMEGTLYEKVEFKIQYDFASGDAQANDIYLGFLDTPAGNIRLGHYKEPFSLETLTSSKYIAFIERSLPVVFAPGRNMGVMFHDSNDRFTWGAGVFRESDEFASSSGEGRRNVTGRVVWRPYYEDEGERFLHIGLGATSKDSAGLNSEIRARPEVHIGSRLANTGGFAVDGQDVVGLEIAGVNGPFWFAAEHLNTTVERPMRGDLGFGGYYAQAGYFLTGESRGYRTSSAAFHRTRPASNFEGGGGAGAWEIALRYSHTDLSDSEIIGGELDGITAAVNWHPNPVTRLMLNWVHPDLDRVGEADFMVVRAQIDF